MTLVARTTQLDDGAVDLVSVAGSDGWLWERDHAGLAGRGVAVHIPRTADVAAVLNSFETVDEVGRPGCGPIAVGALPFDSAAEGSLIVPSLVVGVSPDGVRWMTTVGQAPGPPPHAGGARDPDGFTLTSPIPHTEWMELVQLAVCAIREGSLRKVVLAREIQVEGNRDIDVPTVLRRLRSLYPACTIVSGAVPGGRFVAASPELLVSRLGDKVRSHPLAGTIPRSGDPETDQALAAQLLASPKDRAEHDLVVRDVERTLLPWCTSLSVPDAPSIVALRNVSHLGTLVTGTLGGHNPAPSALDLALELHPTAAVCGTPREAALSWLAKHEGFDRGPYAGPVGWVDSRGDGEWVVGIRSAVVDGPHARLFAGVGVVDGSDPAGELAETQFKLQALLAAVVRP